jgi:hypothetical protein
MVPAQQAAIEATYQAALAKIPDGASKESGIALGKQAAQAVLLARADADGSASESYRPSATPGKYVPTILPVALNVPQRKLWLLASCDQFRPGPPPTLESAIWARDYNEVKALGARTLLGGDQSRRLRSCRPLCGEHARSRPCLQRPSDSSCRHGQ